MKISEVVAKYIELRDLKSTYKAEFDEKVAGVDKKLDMIEAKLLEYFDKSGLESCKTEAGTAYKSVRNSASIADKDAFMAFVKAHEAWGMLIMRANAKTIDEYKAANDNVLPPGVNWTVERVVNFRRT